MVSFEVERLSDFSVPLRAKPQTVDGVLYGDRRTAVIEGPAGEWLELIEAA